MGALHELLAHDHDRLDALLASSVRRDGTIEAASYTQFRGGLLRHIAIEEKILFPAIRKVRGESELLKQLHRDHAALAALLVPPPKPAEIHQIRAILGEHNPLEERVEGLYEIAEEVAGDQLIVMISAVHAMPAVTLAAHVDTSVTRRSIAQLVREAEEGRKRVS